MELGLGLTELLYLPFYLSCILIIILTIFYRIEIGFYFLILLIPHESILFYYLMDYPLGKDINDLLFVALLIKWVIDRRKAKESLFVKTPLNFPLILLLLWTLIGVWWGAHYFGDSLSLSLADARVVYWKNFIRIPLLYLITVNNIKNPNQIRVIIFLMIISVLALDRSFYNVIMYRDMSHYNDAQRAGHLGSLGSNELALCLSMYTIVFVSLFSSIRNVWTKFLLFGTICVSYFCIAFLFSRSGYLATIVGLSFVGFLKNRKILVGLVVLVLFWQALLPVAVKERIEMTKSEEGYDVSTENRFDFWGFGLEVVFASPILGAGLDAAYRLNITSEDSEGIVWHSFHNAYVQQAVETGLVGLGIYLWVFFLMIQAGWRLRRATDDEFQKGLGLALMACVLTCMAGNIAGSHWNYFAVVGYMYVLAGLVVRNMINNEQDSCDHTSDSD